MMELNFSPFPELHTKRLLLREVSKLDAQALMQIRQSDAVMEFIDRPRMKNLEEAYAFIENIISSVEKNESIFWVIAEEENPDLMIGSIGFWRIEKQHYRAEIGYLLHHDHWQKGFMKEAAAAVITWLFDNTQAHSIEANLDAHNTGSVKLLESLGFEREGYFRENYFYKGQFTDSALYSLIRKGS